MEINKQERISQIINDRLKRIKKLYEIAIEELRDQYFLQLQAAKIVSGNRDLVIITVAQPHEKPPRKQCEKFTDEETITINRAVRNRMRRLKNKNVRHKAGLKAEYDLQLQSIIGKQSCNPVPVYRLSQSKMEDWESQHKESCSHFAGDYHHSPTAKISSIYFRPNSVPINRLAAKVVMFSCNKADISWLENCGKRE